METLDSQDVYGVVEEEQKLTKKISQRQKQVCLKNAELEMTQFEIECRSGGHSVTKKFSAVLQLLVSKLKL